MIIELMILAFLCWLFYSLVKTNFPLIATRNFDGTPKTTEELKKKVGLN